MKKNKKYLLYGKDTRRLYEKMNIEKKDPGMQYILTKHILKHLLLKGVITEDEFKRIDKENIKNLEQ
ncbi:MAG TPA: hypothetical protein PK566_17640 [Pseudobacteroides sp.]|nr:hypothetical protein [Pseudobacteroides sp.]